jgi:Fe-Mn family superoxide dismutase
MNKQIAGTELEGKSLEEIVMASWNNGSPTPVFNNAAQVSSMPDMLDTSSHTCIQ